MMRYRQKFIVLSSLMITDESLKNRFLVSMPQLDDPNFNRTVTLLCQHDDSGTMGVVINRSTPQTLENIFSELKIEPTSRRYCDLEVIDGGPVSPELGLFIHSTSETKWESSLQIGDDLYLTSSIDFMESMARGEAPKNVIMSLGYAGWGPGQLESEIHRNSWFTTHVDPDILFSSDVSDKWRKTARLLGIDINLLSAQAGHA
jgi:putative transcriptional regulator